VRNEVVTWTAADDGRLFESIKEAGIHVLEV
jgi:hypothetical protein